MNIYMTDYLAISLMIASPFCRTLPRNYLATNYKSREFWP